MSDSDNLPSDIEIAATSAISALLPVQSKGKYEKTFDIFLKWCNEKSIINKCDLCFVYYKFMTIGIHLLVSILKEYTYTILTGKVIFFSQAYIKFCMSHGP